MTAELQQVQGRASRWRFALGCARVALLSTRFGAAGPTIAASGLAGVAGCIAVTVYFLARHPASGADSAGRREPTRACGGW